MNEKLFASINDVKSIDDDNRIIEFTATKELADYDGDIVKVDGLDISKIKKNKSFLWSHQNRDLPVGKILKMWRDGKTIKGKAQLTSEADYPFGFTVYKLIKGGYINNVSISFIPDYKTMEYKEDKKTGKHVRIINNSTLLEVSAVNIGANNAAMITSKSFKESINKAWDADVIDGSELAALEDLCELKDTSETEQIVELKSVNFALEAVNTKFKTTIKDMQKEIVELKYTIELLEDTEEIEEESIYKQIFDVYKAAGYESKHTDRQTCTIEDVVKTLKGDKK